MFKVNASELTKAVYDANKNQFRDLEVSGNLELSLSGVSTFTADSCIFLDQVVLRVHGNIITLNLTNAQFKSSLSIQLGNGGALNLSGATVSQGYPGTVKQPAFLKLPGHFPSGHLYNVRPFTQNRQFRRPSFRRRPNYQPVYF